MRILSTLPASLRADGGAAAATRTLAEEWRARGHLVDIYSYDDVSRPRGRMRDVVFPIDVHRRVRAAMRNGGIDVVNAIGSDAWLWSAVRSRTSRPALVIRSHGLEHLYYAARREEARRGHVRLSRRYRLYHGTVGLRQAAFALRHADRVLFLNHEERDWAVERIGVRPERAAIVPCGLDAQFVGLQVDIASAEGSPGIAFVGTYNDRKGVQYLSSPLTRILKQYPAVRVTFLGTGCPAAAVLADYDRAVHAQIDVVPSFRRAELPALVRGHQITLLASVAEGFGLALLETMACGLAPVVTAASGPREIVRDGIDGLVVPTRDPAALEQAISRLIDEPGLRARFRAAAYERAQSFSWQDVSVRSLAVFEEALAERA